MTQSCRLYLQMLLLIINATAISTKLGLLCRLVRHAVQSAHRGWKGRRAALTLLMILLLLLLVLLVLVLLLVMLVMYLPHVGAHGDVGLTSLARGGSHVGEVPQIRVAVIVLVAIGVALLN